MKKETLTPQNVAQDLKKVSVFYQDVGAEKRLAFILPAATLAVVLGVLLQSVWIALVILAFAAYGIACAVGALYIKKYNAQNN